VKITAIETIPVSVPLVPERMIVGSRGPHKRSPFLLVLVRTDEGITGIGEASCTPQWSGEDSVTAAHVIERYAAPIMSGRAPGEIERLMGELNRTLVGHQFAKAAIEMALWDIAGKAVGLPVWRLLGGATKDRIRTKFSIAGIDPDQAAGIAAWAVEQGFTAMKVKVATGPLAGDIARIKRVRAEIGDGIELGVDANGNWSRVAAQVGVQHLTEQRIAFLEQPLAPRDVQGMADLTRSSAIPIMADDAIGTPEDALAFAAARGADVFSIYVGMAGGIAPARRAAGVANAAGLGWTIGSNLELGVGLAAHLHLAFSTPGLADDLIPCDIISTFYYETVLLAEPLPIHAGWAAAPTGPGLGVELDMEQVERFREDR
jgi:L-alanine-DL-glutamate epimerase-like enolase superfamily enzyme